MLFASKIDKVNFQTLINKKRCKTLNIEKDLVVNINSLKDYVHLEYGFGQT